MGRPFYNFFKRGDNRQYKHGMHIHMYDPLDYGHTLEQELAHISEWTGTVYYCTRHSRLEKERYLKGLAALGEIGTDGYRPRSLMLDEDKLKSLLGDADINLKLRNGQPLGITDFQDRNGITKNVADQISFPEVFDPNTISSGSYSHGSGGDYADIILLEADIAGTIGSFTFTMVSSQTLNVSCVFNASLGSSLTHNFTTDSYHNGDPTAGYEFVINHSGKGIDWRPTGSGQTVYFCDCKFRRAVAGSSTVQSMFRAFNYLNTEGVLHFKNIFMKGDDSCIGFDISTSNVRIYNTAIRNCQKGFRDVGISGAVELEQCFFHDNTYGADLNSGAVKLTNVASLGNSISAFINTTGGTADFTLADDTTNENGDWSTGTNNISSVTPSSEYELDDTSSDYGSVLEEAPNAASSTSSPTFDSDLMDGAWVNEIGCKVKQTADGPPVGSLSLLGVGR